jgi:site-specific DNA-methyltransferase (adenine-specific)
MDFKTDVVYLGDCVKVLGSIPDGVVQTVATDPPFNIGLAYDLYEDKKDYKAYIAWSKSWLEQCHRILAPNGSIFVCIGDEYQAEINVLLKELGFFWRNTIIWYYTFGENQKKKFNRTHTVIHYFTKSATDYKFLPEAVKVPSKRQLMGDKRAKAGGKLPDDVWESTSHQDVAPSALPDDVWKISRVCGTFKERILDADGSAHPCQMPSSVMERMIKCSTESGDLVVDPFCGTGTTAAAAQSLGRKFITMDMSEKYAGVAAERLYGDPTRFVRF